MSDADAFYSQRWKSPEFSGPEPNYDGQQRWHAIERFVRMAYPENTPLRKILDVGCGRGWLANKLSAYGTAEGLDVTPSAITMARDMFPRIKFSVMDVIQLNDAIVAQYGEADLAVSSEVIEHVPRANQGKFLDGIMRLLRPGGYLILTTPRGEFWNAWNAKGYPHQPVEEWLTEHALGELTTWAGFRTVARDRVYVPGYDYHPSSRLMRGRLSSRALRWIPYLKNAVIYANSIYQVVLLRKPPLTSTGRDTESQRKL